MKRKDIICFLLIVIFALFGVLNCQRQNVEKREKNTSKDEQQNELSEQDSCSYNTRTSYAELNPELKLLEEVIDYFNFSILNATISLSSSTSGQCEESQQCIIDFVEQKGGEYIANSCREDSFQAKGTGEVFLDTAKLEEVERIYWRSKPVELSELPSNLQKAFADISLDFPSLDKDAPIYPVIIVPDSGELPDSILIRGECTNHYRIEFFHGWCDCSSGCINYVLWIFRIDENGDYELTEKECHLNDGSVSSDCEIALFDQSCY